VAAPLRWAAPLLDFQREGVHALVESEVMLLADDMGLGKTCRPSQPFVCLPIEAS